MANLNTIAMTKLSTSEGVDMKTVGNNSLYIVPSGKTGYITHVIIRNPSASMAGGTEYNFTNWKQSVDLSSLTTPETDFIILDTNNTKFQNLISNDSFEISIATGTTSDCTVDIDVFGYLI